MAEKVSMMHSHPPSILYWREDDLEIKHLPLFPLFTNFEKKKKKKTFVKDVIVLK